MSPGVLAYPELDPAPLGRATAPPRGPEDPPGTALAALAVRANGRSHDRELAKLSALSQGSAQLGLSLAHLAHPSDEGARLGLVVLHHVVPVEVVSLGDRARFPEEQLAARVAAWIEGVRTL